MKNSKAVIRRATEKDIALLAELGARTFREAFGSTNDPADMDLYISANFSPEQIAREIADPHSAFLLAYDKNVPLGYAKLKAGPAPRGVRDANPLELERIYVDRSFIGQGYGAALMQACLEEATGNGYKTIWLGVWERNTPAIAFYHKWEFKEVGSQEFVLGNDVQRDLLMERVLDK